jgi:hypothetical protein
MCVTLVDFSMNTLGRIAIVEFTFWWGI